MDGKWSSGHIFHCAAFLIFIAVFEAYHGPGLLPIEGSYRLKDGPRPPMWHSHGGILGLVLLLLKCVSFLSLPLMIFHLFGLIFYETFPSEIRRIGSPLFSPYICFRVVTRGDYPDLVKRNVERNMTIISEAGVTNYIMEVVTDKPLNLTSNQRFREVVVPTAYVTSTGAKFKARALQHCLEEEINILEEKDWIVHLDEETLLTPGCVTGILNFTTEDKHDIGQGLITYASNEIINWFTTLADSFRVAADLGAVRYAFHAFKRAIFIFKGSYVVTRYGVERAVSFDNGAAGSIAEDTYFAMKAVGQGYSFGWIEGEMQEKSPFGLWDFFQQRKRWLQGIFLIVHCPDLPLSTRFPLGLGLYAWITLPISLVNTIVDASLGVSLGILADWLLILNFAIGLYMYIFGAMRSFRFSRIGFCRYFLYILGAIATLPVNIVVETLAVVFGLLQDKHKFYIVDKQFEPVQQEIV